VTACAYIHPPFLPTIISDLVVTRVDTGSLTPTNIFTGPPPSAIASLARKTFVLGDLPIVLAFSGNVRGIREIIKGLGPELNMIDASRPMRAIGDMINSFICKYNLPISAIGFAPTNPNVNVLKGFWNDTFDTQHFNESVVCGTGSAWLKSQIKFADQSLGEWKQDVSPEGMREVVRLIGTIGMINSKAIFQPHTLQGDSSFGGYFELTTLENYKSISKRPSWAHVGYSNQVSETEFNFWTIPKQVSYYPDCRVVVTRLIEKYGSQVKIWPIESLHIGTDSPSESFPAPPDGVPDCVTVFIDFPHIKKCLHRTLTSSEKQQSVTCVDGIFHVSLDFISELSAEFLTSL